MKTLRSLRLARALLFGLAVALPASHSWAQGAISITGPGTPTMGTVLLDPNFVTLHSFGGLDGRDLVPQALTQGTDGKFYGATEAGGATSYGHGPQDNGVIYSITPRGDFALVHAFGTAADGFGFQPSGIIPGRDGRLYGMTSGNTGAAEPTYSGAAFALDPAGAASALYQFRGTKSGSAIVSVTPAGKLCEGLDGNFYGIATSAPGGTFNTFFRLTPAGAVTTLYTFRAVDTPLGSLVRDDVGNFYGALGASKDNANGSLFKITPDGTLTVLHTFTGGDDGSSPFPLTRGRDGFFYGVTTNTTTTNVGTVFRLATDGTLTTLYRFAGQNDGYQPNSIVQANDGNLYGTTSGENQNSPLYGNGGTMFRLTLAGVLTKLHGFGGNSLATMDDGFLPNALVFGSDGCFYGTTFYGGRSGYGTVFRMAVPGVHPEFFTGEVALGNSVGYLAFSDTGSVFGYYAFLADPHSLYHFDLGYEYVFDAADGKSGVYLYDFRSGDFLYTSPSFPFPYLYDFALNTVLYYYPDPTQPGRYNTDGVRYFYNFATGQIITR